MSVAVRPLGVVVTTIGRRAGLERLIDSLAGQHVVLAIAIQGGEASLQHDLESRCAELGIDHRIGPSGGGASRGRNDAAAWTEGLVDVLAFPNDTTVFPPGAIDRIRVATSKPRFSAGAVTVTDPTGPKFVLPPAGTPLTPRNVWDVILPGLLVRADVFRQLGGFDETLGTGSATPWQSGEETALLLRHREEVSADFTWLGAIEVCNPHDTAGLDARHRRRKLRGYARGYGRVLRLHGYGLRALMRALLAGVTFGLRHEAPYTALDGGAVAVGRLEGFVGVVLGGARRTALKEAPAAVLRRETARV